VRLAVVRRPWRYARSFFGIIDLLAILPTYLSLVFVGAQHLIVIRVLRILRVFRILKLTQYVGEAGVLMTALYSSRRKILVFVISVISLATIFGAVMYLVEGPENGFTSIPRGIYWAVVTMATVGFGDITPKTGLGQAITMVIIIIGYGIIAVPTGIFTAAMVRGRGEPRSEPCPRCGLADQAADARFCRRCGERLAAAPNDADQQR
jgi:voltage-gated potassium channel